MIEVAKHCKAIRISKSRIVEAVRKYPMKSHIISSGDQCQKIVESDWTSGKS